MSKQRDEDHTQRAIEEVNEALDRSSINPRSDLPAFLQLAMLLRATIVVRQLQSGSPLPSESDLQARYGVSRDTVRRAVTVLREAGLVETRRGLGVSVIRTIDIAEVHLAPGTRITARMPQPGDPEPSGGQTLGLLVYVVQTPGEPPRTYDTATTVLVVPE